jgi:hypothetical protein
MNTQTWGRKKKENIINTKWRSLTVVIFSFSFSFSFNVGVWIM